MNDSKDEPADGTRGESQVGDNPYSGPPVEEPRSLTGPLRPLVDLAARIGVGVHTKLLTAFLVGVLLLLGMGVLSLVVINRMSGRVDDLTALQERVDRARQMEYVITAQGGGYRGPPAGAHRYQAHGRAHR